MKYAALSALSLAVIGCAGAEPVTITPAQPAVPPAEVTVDARPAPKPEATAKPAEAASPADEPKEAAKHGIIGLLNAGKTPNIPLGPDDSLGNDPLSAKGNMWGGDVGESFGVGGLGLSGVGPGAGGTGQGTIGLGSLGAIGRSGIGVGQGYGIGRGGLKAAKPPKIEVGATQVNGRLPPEVIRRIVRQNYGRFRLCYEKGLHKNPKLAGKVVVKFVIGRDGSVSNAVHNGSTMNDAAVLSCVVRAFDGLAFPQPQGGVVVVNYPMTFSPPGGAPAAAPPPPKAPPPPTQSDAKADDTTDAPKR